MKNKDSKKEETFGRKKYKEYKMKFLKKTWKMMAFIMLIMAIVFAGVGILISADVNTWIMLYGFLLVAVITSIVFPLLIAKHPYIPYKEINKDGMYVAAFIERNATWGDDFVVIHLIVNQNEFVKQVNIRTYRYYAKDIVFNAIELAEYFADKKRDTQNGTNIAILTKKINKRNIIVLYEKYSNKLELIIAPEHLND